MLCSGQAFASSHRINHYKEFVENRWSFLTSGQYFKSTSNFNKNGNIADLPGGNSFQLIDLTGTRGYGLSDAINLYGGLNIGNSQSKGSDATRTNSSVNNIIAGAEFLIPMDGFQLIPEVSGLADLEKLSDTQDSVMNSEVSNELTGKLNVQMALRDFLLFGYGGYNYRTGGRSQLFLWGVNGELALSKFTLGGEIFGFQSVSDDVDKGTPAEANRDAFRLRVNGGSARFYSVNPSVVDSNVYLKSKISDQFDFWLAAGLPVVGNNYANGYHAEAGLRFLIGDHVARRLHHRAVSVPVDDSARLSTDKKVDRFQEDTNDGVDQRIFKPTPTAVPKAVKPAPTDQELKDQMDDAETKIELRSNKKKKRVNP
jgi:hypothetical protein